MARDAPAFEDADDCTRECCCRGCKPDLSDEARRKAGLQTRRQCGCMVCLSGIVARS